MRQINEYIRSDYYRYFGKCKSLIYIYIYGISGRNPCFSYGFWRRLCMKKNFFYFLAVFMHVRLTRKYGIQIHRNIKIGYGFKILHGVGIVINKSAEIGNNCNISQFTTIGSNHSKAAKIGDNVYIGPSVCIVEDVLIGNNVSIGAGAVVVKDIPDNTTVAGVPAKPIVNSKVTPGQFITNRWDI